MKKKFTTRDLILCALFTALSAIGAFIRIPVPLVPFTLQITFTTLAGLLLGSKKGAISVAVYVLMGLIGIPVFTQGGGFSFCTAPIDGSRQRSNCGVAFVSLHYRSIRNRTYCRKETKSVILENTRCKLCRYGIRIRFGCDLFLYYM